MKKILIIHHGMGYGGALTALLRLIDELKDDYKIEVLCIFNSSAVDYLSKKGIKVSVLNSFFYRRIYKLFVHSEASFLTIPSFIRKFIAFITYLLNMFIFAPKVLRSKNYDILYLNSVFLSDWTFYGSKAKIIMHVREPIKCNVSLYSYVLKSVIKNNVNKVIAVSVDNADRLNIKDTSIIYDPIQNINKSNKISQGKIKYFTYVGGTQRIKGFEVLIKSLPYLDENIKINILGPIVKKKFSIRELMKYFITPYSFREQLYLKRMFKSDKVKIIGLVDDITPYIIDSEAIISPFSKPHASLPILESFGLGVPVICSKVSGTSELVCDNFNGVFFSTDNHIDLANKINTFSKLPTTIKETYRTNAYNTITRIYNNCSSVKKIIGVLHE